MNRIVIGVGNPARGDDGAGVVAAQRSGSNGLVATAPFQLMELWEGEDDVVVVDAARSGASPGTILRFEAGSETLPTGVLGGSTHALGVAEVVELARAMGRLPPRLMVYGIEIGDLSQGSVLSPEVDAAVDSVVAEVGHA
ncbi:MAG TPA: hydrogenase maturation protease [Acidimicrobiia bacterium]|nr:hydrogenase maturation protease [Acidimicrobiia bacterium]